MPAEQVGLFGPGVFRRERGLLIGPVVEVPDNLQDCGRAGVFSVQAACECGDSIRVRSDPAQDTGDLLIDA